MPPFFPSLMRVRQARGSQEFPHLSYQAREQVKGRASCTVLPLKSSAIQASFHLEGDPAQDTFNDITNSDALGDLRVVS